MPSPMVTASLQAATISSASNVLAQIIGPYRQNVPFAFDTTEFLRFVILSFLTAPPNFKWQQLLERLFPAYETASSTLLPLTHLDKKEDTQEEDDPTQAKRKLNIKNTLTKWFIDCMTFGALLNTVAFLVLIGILKGQSKDQIVNHVRTDTFKIIVNSYKIWPVASIISFSFVPAEKRIVFLSIVGLAWGVYMSLVAAAL